ncbi:MAG: twin-arginine translocase subunit TatC, partial [Rhodobacteraceae bacterium]|nr:twin-arginine translocase subunit TatC [Paracoccaceae bacterium]
MSADEQIEDSAAPLIEHLAELRQRLIWSALAFIVAMVICFTVWNPIFNFLTSPLCSAMAERGHPDCGLILIRLQEGFFVAINISLLGGFALSFPVIAYQLWRFVAPGLYKSEKNAFLPFLIASPIMFVMGAAFAYYIVTPLAFDFFLGFQQAGSV